MVLSSTGFGQQQQQQTSSNHEKKRKEEEEKEKRPGRELTVTPRFSLKVKIRVENP